MESDLTANLRLVSGIYARETGMKLSTVGQQAAGDWRFFDRLEAAEHTFTVRKYDRVMQWLSNEWPPGVDWPEAVQRPEREQPAARVRKGRSRAVETACA